MRNLETRIKRKRNDVKHLENDTYSALNTETLKYHSYFMRYYLPVFTNRIELQERRLRQTSLHSMKLIIFT